ncbi:MAG: branched-chain amino acid transaminase [SAR202 cluster bacterium]|nr:branched-chain amino acid transaminase [SAR202 cluster bacterium]
MPKSLAYFKGKVVPISDANINIMTHALHYGTAIFEGIRGNWNESEQKLYVFKLKEHYQRLLQGCKIMMMDIPYSVDDLCEITINLLKETKHKQDVYIRPIAYKSEELVANLKLHEIEDDFNLIVIPFGAYLDTEGTIRCTTSSWRRMEDTNVPPRIKVSGNYVNSILAKTEAVLAGFDEAILLNGNGVVSEGSGENLFLVINNELHTPELSDNILTGITRDSIKTIAQNDLKIPVIERRINRSEIYLADEMFLTGTAAHVTAVGELDNRTIGSGSIGPVTKQIQKIYSKAIRGQDPKYLNWCTACEY